MFVMSMLDRLTDVKKSTYAKIIAVLVSVAMVLSLTNMSAFAEGDGLSGIFGGNSDVVKVAVDLDNAKIEYGDQTVTNADKTFVASAGKDLKFKASAVTEDFTLDEVALVTIAENGDEVVTDLEGIDGTYTIKADDVADGITIKASATEQKTAAKDSTVITDNQSGDEVAGAETTEPGTTDNGTAENGSTENGTTEEPSTETPAAGTPTVGTSEGTTPEGTPTGTVTEPTTETPAGTTTPAADPVENVAVTQSVMTMMASAFSTMKLDAGVDTLSLTANGQGSTRDNPYVVRPGSSLKITTDNPNYWWSTWSVASGFTNNNGKFNNNKAPNVSLTNERSSEVTLNIDASAIANSEYTVRYQTWTTTEYFYITVEQGSYVYLYTKIVQGNDSLRLPANKEGWITLGKLWVAGLDAAKGVTGNAGDYFTNKGDYFSKVKQALENLESNFTPFRASDAIDFSNIEWTGTYREQNGKDFTAGLRLSDGASDYNDQVSGRQWHLDGALDVSDSGQVTVKYVEKGSNQQLKAPVTLTGKKDTVAQIEQASITGYKFDSQNPAGEVKYEKNRTREVTLYYVKDESQTHTISAQVQYFLGDTLEAAKAATEANHTDAVVTSEPVWIGTAASVTATPNANSVPTGYKLVVEEGTQTTFDLAVNAATPETTNVVKAYYVKDETQTQSTSYTIHYFLDDVEQTADMATVTGTAWVNDNPAQIAIAEGGIAAPADKYANYTPHAVKNAEQNWPEAGDMVQSGSAYNVYYVTDRVSTDPTNPGNPDPNEPGNGDGIPDMYQALVQYVAVNGSVNIDHTYVTLLDENGQPSENGTGYLTAEQIAVATAAEGYDQDSLAWDVVPTTENAITGEVTYTATFTANQPVVPADPGTPGTTPTPAPAGPVPGAAPAALAPVAAALAAPVAALIGDEPTPLAEEAIGDEEDPLAAFDHVNCWVHYYMILGILLTLVYGGCVIARRSNYSRKIQKMDDYATGKAMDTVEETENVANAAAQKMEA